MVKNCLKLALCLCFLACSTKARKEQDAVRDFFQRGLYSEALELLENSELKSREENRLLYLLHKGRLLRAQGRHYQAAQVFTEATELMDRLYTKSVKEALLAGLVNNNSETYYGSPYERSLLYYYQALSFLEVYRRGYILEAQPSVDGAEELWIKKEIPDQQRRQYLFSARAAIVAWDTFYQDLQRSSREQTHFDHDLFAKILAAQVHELVGGRNDEQIALQLYQDALHILERYGPAFKSFNPDFEQYAKNLISGKKTETENPTDRYTQLKDFLSAKILGLAKRRQGHRYASLKKKLAPTTEALALAEERTNVSLVVERSVVAQLVTEDFAYNLRSAMENIEDPSTRALVAGIGLPVLTYFAMGPLGLVGTTTSGNTRLYVTHGVGEALTAEAGIEFEMAVIREPEAAQELVLSIYKRGEDGLELVATSPSALVGPISDLAYQMNLERASNAFAARGARIALKHVVAIVAAYQTYQSMKESSGEVFAKPAAFAQYVLSAKAIKESEKADTRQWSTLPSEVYLSELSLPPGEYVLKAQWGENSNNLRELGSFVVQADRARDIFSFTAPAP